jgi:hypothetical protein
MMTNEQANTNSHNFSESAKITVSKDNVFCELEGEAVILNLRDGVYYGLNPVGLRIWELIQSPKTLNEILETLTAEYEVERAVCQADVETLLKQLSGKGLIEISAAG